MCGKQNVDICVACSSYNFGRTFWYFIVPFSATRSTGQCATSLTAGPGSGECAALGGGAARTRGREEGEREGVTSNIGGEREKQKQKQRGWRHPS